jgi:branched-chain amino acid transport system permease protein
METLLAQIVNGLATGGIYALIVLGMNLLVLVRGVVYFSYAHIVVISMAVGWLVLQFTGGSLVLAVPVFVVTAGAITVLTEPLFRPLALRRAFLETVVLALGIGIIITEVMSQFINEGAPIAFPASLTGGGAMIRSGMISFSLARVYTLVGAIAAVIGLFYFLYHHRQGRAIRAIAQDVVIARFLGIPFKKTGIYGFAIAGLLAGIIALLIAMSLGSASAELSDNMAVKAMILMLFAGMGNLKGGLISALLMGLAEAMALAYLPGRWTEAVFFGVIMLVIIWKPQGLFGART